MAAFVDYTTRDRGVLGYRGYEQALNDLELIRITYISKEIGIRMLYPNINLTQLNSILINNDVNQLADILDFSNEELTQRINNLNSSLINLANKGFFTANVGSRLVMTTQSSRVDLLISNIRKIKKGIPTRGGSFPYSATLNCKTGYTAVWVEVSFDQANYLRCLSGCALAGARIPSIGNLAFAICPVGCYYTNAKFELRCVRDYFSSGKPRNGGLD